jgi:hypothetical protein
MSSAANPVDKEFRSARYFTAARSPRNGGQTNEAHIYLFFIIYLISNQNLQLFYKVMC